MSFVPKTCTYISATELVPKRWKSWFWAELSENAPFSWGDNKHSLVTMEAFIAHCEKRFHRDPKVNRWLRGMRLLLPSKWLVDLET